MLKIAGVNRSNHLSFIWSGAILSYYTFFCKLASQSSVSSRWGLVGPLTSKNPEQQQKPSATSNLSPENTSKTTANSQLAHAHCACLRITNSSYQQVAVVCICHSVRESRRPRTVDTNSRKSSICSHPPQTVPVSSFEATSLWKYVPCVPSWLCRLPAFATSVSLLMQWLTKLYNPPKWFLRIVWKTANRGPTSRSGRSNAQLWPEPSDCCVMGRPRDRS